MVGGMAKVEGDESHVFSDTVAFVKILLRSTLLTAIITNLAPL